MLFTQNEIFKIKGFLRGTQLKLLQIEETALYMF